MLYYAGAAAGGVWKSTDGGVSWEPRWTGPPFASIGALALDPRRDAVLWAGTGEANPRNDVSWGDGIWRSNDGAKHWTHLGLTGSSQIARISIDPRDSNDVVVAALGSPWKDTPERGVYRTLDGGNTWRRTLYADGSTGAADLARDPHDPRRLYAALWHFRRRPWGFTSGGGRGDGLYLSADGGTSWRRLLGRGFPAAPLGRIGLAIAPGNSRRVYAVVQSKAGTVWRSDDAGVSWRRVSSDTMPEQRPFYFSHLAVDPKNENRVISASMYLSESKDAGRTWRHLTDVLHVDNHALWWSADGKRLINGNDGGIALSVNGGASWSMPLDLAIGQIYHAGYDLSDPYTVCGGFQDNGAWCAPSNSRDPTGVLERDWLSVNGGDGEWILPDPADPGKVWADSQDGSLSIYDLAAHQSIEVEPWPRDAFTDESGLANKRYRFNWDSPLAFSPEDPHVAYFGGNVVFRTNDEGRTWTQISPDLTRNEKDHQRTSGGPIGDDVSGAEFYDTLLALAPSPADAGTMWAGSDDGLVQLTRDGGATWRNVTPPQLPRYARVESIDAPAGSGATAFIAADRHDLGDAAPYLFVTDDAGAHWRRIDAGLPREASTHVVRDDPRTPNVLYAGTEQGVWYSTDRGRHWLPLQFNLPVAPVYDLQVQPQADDLIVATHGRSFWILDDLTPVQDAATTRSGPYLFPPRPGTLWAQWSRIETGDGNAVPANVFAGRNPAGPALITFWLPRKARVRPAIAIVAPNGRIVRHLSGSYKTDEGTKFWVSDVAGYNRLAWDGTEDGPVRWNGTTLQNAGPLTGAEALPGPYIVRLSVNGKSYEQPFTLRADPRSPWTPEQSAARHAYLERLYGDISQLDVLLNEIDAQERTLRNRHDAVASLRRTALDGLRARLTADDRRDEDSVAKPDRLREQLFGAAGVIGGSYQPPFAAHAANGDALQATFEAAYAAGEALLRTPSARAAR
jgi:photosystem II stability/assembly factor-like uncharacterized protein